MERNGRGEKEREETEKKEEDVEEDMEEEEEEETEKEEEVLVRCQREHGTAMCWRDIAGDLEMSCIWSATMQRWHGLTDTAADLVGQLKAQV